MGSLIYRQLPKKDRENKLSPISEEGILIGFKSINYQVYIPETDSIKIIRDITILENKKYSKRDFNSNIDSLILIENQDEGQDEENNTTISP